MSAPVTDLFQDVLPNLPTLGQRIAHVTQDADLKAEVLQALKVNEVTLKRWIAAKTKVSAEGAIQIAQTTRVPIDWLLTGSAATRLPTLNDKDVIWVPRLEISASAGSGLAALAVEAGAPREIAFRQSWLRNLGIAPHNAEFVAAQGDSMFPTIQDGDLMLLDRGYGEVVNGKIYVLVVNGLVLVKRVSMLAFGGLMLISDNDRYPSETVARDEVNSVNFQARVAWYGRAI